MVRCQARDEQLTDVVRTQLFLKIGAHESTVAMLEYRMLETRSGIRHGIWRRVYVEAGPACVLVNM